jgi:hypothetical protein
MPQITRCFLAATTVRQYRVKFSSGKNGVRWAWFRHQRKTKHKNPAHNNEPAPIIHALTAAERSDRKKNGLASIRNADAARKE